MAAGVGKTYRMLLEGRQAQEEGRDVVIGYLEPHDRPETTALAEGLEVVPRLRTQHGALELEEMDVDAVIRRVARARAHRRARAHERGGNAQREALAGHRGGARRRHRRHLDRQRPAPRESQRRDLRADRDPRARDVPRPHPRRRRRGRARRPVARRSCRNGCAPARSIRRSAPRSRSRTSSAPTSSPCCASSPCARSPRTSRRGRVARTLEPLSQQAVAERVLALIEPQPKSQRIMRRAWRSAQRLGTEMDAVWVQPPGRPPTEEEVTQLAALRRLAGILGAHFLEEEGDDLVATVRRVAAERGSTYIFVGTPDESRRREIFGGSLLSRMVRELPGPRHPRRREPRRPGPVGGMIAAVIALAALAAVLGAALVVRSGFRLRRPRAGARRVLVPFTGGTLDPTVLDAAIRLAQAEDADSRPGLPPARPAPLCGGLAAARRGGRRDAAARGGRARGTPCGRARSMRGSRRGGARHTRCAVCGTRSTSTGSSRLRRTDTAAGSPRRT